VLWRRLGGFFCIVILPLYLYIHPIRKLILCMRLSFVDLVVSKWLEINTMSGLLVVDGLIMVSAQQKLKSFRDKKASKKLVKGTPVKEGYDVFGVHIPKPDMPSMKDGVLHVDGKDVRLYERPKPKKKKKSSESEKVKDVISEVAEDIYQGVLFNSLYR